MLIGAEIIEMWSELTAERAREQHECLASQQAAITELVEAVRTNPCAPKLNPASRFLDWHSLPAFHQDLAWYSTDVLQCAHAYQQAVVHFWNTQLDLASRALGHSCVSLPKK